MKVVDLIESAHVNLIQMRVRLEPYTRIIAWLLPASQSSGITLISLGYPRFRISLFSYQEITYLLVRFLFLKKYMPLHPSRQTHSCSFIFVSCGTRAAAGCHILLDTVPQEQYAPFLNDCIFFCPNLEHFCPLFVQIAQMGLILPNTTTNPCSLLSRHKPFLGYVLTRNNPSPTPKTPLSWPNFDLA